MHDLQQILLSSEVGELTDEVGRLFDDLDRSSGCGGKLTAGYCTPALDVLETDAAVEVVIDVPGTGAESLRVLLKGDVLIVAGDKSSPCPGERVDATFHLVERGFGRFARAVRLDGAFDGSRVRAVLCDGELRVVVPKLTNRRDREILVPIVTA